MPMIRSERPGTTSSGTSHCEACFLTSLCPHDLDQQLAFGCLITLWLVAPFKLEVVASALQ